jgi:O-succinylbenzoate synthase
MQPIQIQDIILHEVAIPLAEPLKTSFGGDLVKTAILIELTTAEGVKGWGEVAVEIEPGYGPETMNTALHILRDHILPAHRRVEIIHPTLIPRTLERIRGHRHTKAGFEAAVWDAFAKANHLRLADLFAGCLPAGHEPRAAANVGVSIGIQPTIDETLAIIQKRLDQGYGRIKLKIMPGWDVDMLAAVRGTFPEILLMADANSAYSLSDLAHLKRLDAFQLTMIEQPLGHDDIYEHSLLQPQMATPICLDESVKSSGDLRLALQVGACRILNLKPARVGGFTESLEIYRICSEEGLPLWIGGMLETGIGRAANVAFASLPRVTLPCDISATDRYFEQDITEPPFILSPGSTITLPRQPGIGVDVIAEQVRATEEFWKTLPKEGKHAG